MFDKMGMKKKLIDELMENLDMAESKKLMPKKMEMEVEVGEDCGTELGNAKQMKAIAEAAKNGEEMFSAMKPAGMPEDEGAEMPVSEDVWADLSNDDVKKLVLEYMKA